ncbi:MAG TPA: DUF4198 domain-containing protein [Thermoanaerobaculia bacterium]|nr:DUF4198 domain-containing protein [Thermoanaerobaculia bacterium]
MRASRALGLATWIGLLVGPALQAHDFWIEPSAFTPALGQRISVRLRVGEGFRGDPVPRDPQRIERFAALGAAGEVAIAGVPNSDPAGFLALNAPGLHLLVYDSDHASVELEGKKFEEYLGLEGLEAISALRARRGQTAAPVKEIYSRCAKSLVAVGKSAKSAGYDRSLGLPLELVPEANPYSLDGGGDLAVRLDYGGKPLAGALVMALQRDRPEPRIAVRSDSRGRVKLRLDRPGVWLIKAVHMVPAPKESGADWESFWASLTFEVPGGKR